jgi:hypothetical protein
VEVVRTKSNPPVGETIDRQPVGKTIIIIRAFGEGIRIDDFKVWEIKK